jgi:hypothetical protein
MILSDLLDSTVRDAGGAHLGYVVDARLVLDGPPGPLLAGARLHGLLVSPRTRTSFFGYERTEVRAPWPIASYLRRRHRGTFLVLWEDVAATGRDSVVLRRGYRAYDPALPRSH